MAKKYSDDVYEAIWEMKCDGWSPRQIARKLQMPKSTVRDIIEKRKKEAGSGVSEPSAHPVSTDQVTSQATDQAENQTDQAPPEHAATFDGGKPIFEASEERVFVQDTQEPEKESFVWLKRLKAAALEKWEGVKDKWKWNMPKRSEIKGQNLMAGTGKVRWNEAADWELFVDWVGELHLRWLREYCTFIPEQLREHLIIPRYMVEKVALAFAPWYWNLKDLFIGGEVTPGMAGAYYLYTVGASLAEVVLALKTGTYSELLEKYEKLEKKGGDQ